MPRPGRPAAGTFQEFLYLQRQRCGQRWHAAEIRVAQARKEAERQADLEWQIRGSIASCCGLRGRPHTPSDSD